MGEPERRAAPAEVSPRRGAGIGRRTGLAALFLSFLAVAGNARAQGAGAFPRRFDIGMADGEMAPGSADFPLVSFRRSTGDGLLAIGGLPEDSQMQSQLLAAFGLKRFSFRVRSWRHVGPGPSVHAGTLSVVRNVNLLPAGPDTGMGISMTMYRLGARFESVYHRRPVSVHVFFRIRFGGNEGAAGGIWR